MTDKLQEITQEIAKRHGVLVGKDDPVLMMHTMNEMLMQENMMVQQNMLSDFKSAMEHCHQGWESAAHRKAENILNSSLHKSKEALERVVVEMADQCFQEVQRRIEDCAAKRNQSVSQSGYKYVCVAAAALMFGIFLTRLFERL